MFSIEAVPTSANCRPQDLSNSLRREANRFNTSQHAKTVKYILIKQVTKQGNYQSQAWLDESPSENARRTACMGWLGRWDCFDLDYIQIATANNNYKWDHKLMWN